MHIACLQMWYFLQAEMFSWLLFKIVLHVKVLSIKINLFILLTNCSCNKGKSRSIQIFYFFSFRTARKRKDISQIQPISCLLEFKIPLQLSVTRFTSDLQIWLAGGNLSKNCCHTTAHWCILRSKHDSPYFLSTEAVLQSCKAGAELPGADHPVLVSEPSTLLSIEYKQIFIFSSATGLCYK